MGGHVAALPLRTIQEEAIDFACNNRFANRFAKGRVSIGAVVFMRATINNFVAHVFHHRNEVLFQREPRVIGPYRNPHGQESRRPQLVADLQPDLRRSCVIPDLLFGIDDITPLLKALNDPLRYRWQDVRALLLSGLTLAVSNSDTLIAVCFLQRLNCQCSISPARY